MIILVILIIGHLYGCSVQMGCILHRRHGNGRLFISAAFGILKRGCSQPMKTQNSDIYRLVCGSGSGHGLGLLVVWYSSRFINGSTWRKLHSEKKKERKSDVSEAYEATHCVVIAVFMLPRINCAPCLSRMHDNQRQPRGKMISLPSLREKWLHRAERPTLHVIGKMTYKRPTSPPES